MKKLIKSKKTLISKIKDFNYKKVFKNFIKDFKQFVKYNRQFISFVVLGLISCIIIRYSTIGIFWDFKGSFFDFTMLLFLGSFAYFIKPRKQHIYFFVVLFIISVINIINDVYYSFFSSFVSISLLATAGQAAEQGGAVLEKLHLYNFVYLIMPLIFVIINSILRKKDYFTIVDKLEKGKKNFLNILILSGICLFINIATLTGTDISRFSKQWNREYIVERFGIIVYQINDTFQVARSNINSLFGYEEAAEEFADYYNNREDTTSNNKYTNMFDGYNVIVIHMESIMNFLIGLEINGEEVTPNLNKLVNNSMYFNNFYSEVSIGTSSDAEFTFSSSLMPVQSGTVAVSYYNRKYVTLQSLLAEKGYYTFSMHGNKASMWNRAKLHTSLGYMDFFSKEYYDVDEIIGLGLSDRSFFNQSESKISDIYDMVNSSDEYTNYMGTLITLSNHTPFGDDYYLKGDDSFDVTYHTGKYDSNGNEIIYDYLDGQMIGNYIKSAHYADECLGEFIDYVSSHDEYNKTVFIMYGDHAAQLSKSQFEYFVNYNFETGEAKTEEDEGYVDYDYYQNEIFKKVPLFIWTPNQSKNNKIKGTVSYVMGMIDVLPTVANMLGIYDQYALGHDIFEVKDNNTVVFPNGNFITNKVYYYNSKNEYKILGTDIKIDEDYIDDRKKYTEEILNTSNNIIVYDLINKAADRIGVQTNEE